MCVWTERRHREAAQHSKHNQRIIGISERMSDYRCPLVVGNGSASNCSRFHHFPPAACTAPASVWETQQRAPWPQVMSENALLVEKGDIPSKFTTNLNLMGRSWSFWRRTEGPLTWGQLSGPRKRASGKKGHNAEDVSLSYTGLSPFTSAFVRGTAIHLERISLFIHFS